MREYSLKSFIRITSGYLRASRRVFSRCRFDLVPYRYGTNTLYSNQHMFYVDQKPKNQTPVLVLIFSRYRYCC
ncbi:hypothetical protein HanRHA438_Chr17g0798471 [Helianthus annuus]|nr:hypothetical protein HanRHA438_Chr17g0798471 [Helianthus annuus]